jgi:hypothetical protein
MEDLMAYSDSSYKYCFGCQQTWPAREFDAKHPTCPAAEVAWCDPNDMTDEQVNDVVTGRALLPTDSQARKDTPIYSGVLRYFPRALAYIAKVSKAGNDKHNPGQPLHWSKGKSNDHGDCVARHLIEAGTLDPDDNLLHSGKLAWRALALLETELENGEKSA